MTVLETGKLDLDRDPEPATTRLRLALPKGRMAVGVDGLLADAGIRVSSDGRGYRPSVDGDGPFETKRLKPQAVVSMIAAGSRDVGFAGADWAMELGVEESLVEVFDTTLDRVRVVAAAPPSVDLDRRSGSPVRIATEMPKIASAWASACGLDYEIVRSWGATEVLPPEDADVIVDLVQTGETLAANDLRVIEEISRSSTRMYASIDAFECPRRGPSIRRLGDLLRSVIEARARYLVDLNVAADRLDEVLAILPSMRRPTVSPLAAGGFAVRAAVPRSGFATLVNRLRGVGATDLVVGEARLVIP